MLQKIKTKFIVIGLIGALLLFATPSSSEAQSYVVQKGDSLWKIAQSSNTTIPEIMELNNIKSDLIYPGTILQIPSTTKLSKSGNTASPTAYDNETNNNAFSSYTVREGDSLWLIAQKYQVQVADLIKFNQLKDDLIYPGQSLVINRATTQNSKHDLSPSRGSSIKIVDIAKRFLGVPYVYGGSSPVNGFDCSGFVQYVYSLYGKNIPRTAAEQAHTAQKVETPIPGDLVCFADNNGYVFHVGIYIGNNSFIHASNKQGVVITSLSDNWYQSRYAGSYHIS